MLHLFVSCFLEELIKSHNLGVLNVCKGLSDKFFTFQHFLNNFEKCSCKALEEPTGSEEEAVTFMAPPQISELQAKDRKC